MVPVLSSNMNVRMLCGKETFSSKKCMSFLAQLIIVNI